MALPVILVDSATGSDTAASGAGPSTAITGAAGVTSADGLTVTLDGSPNLSGVATDGSAVIFMSDTAAGARNFGKITAVDNTLKTVTVANAFGLSNTDAWAIGGKRASIGGALSTKLFSNNSAAGDAMPGWIIELQSGHSETITATYVLRRSGDVTDGVIVIRAASGAATRPILTFSNDGSAIRTGASQNYFLFKGFEMRNSNATKTASIALDMTTNVSNHIVIEDVKISHSTNNYWKGVTLNGKSVLKDCEIGYTASHGIDTGSGVFPQMIFSNYIHHCTGNGINTQTDTMSFIFGNIIYLNSGDGIRLATATAGVNRATQIINNTIDSNTGDGLEVTAATTQMTVIGIINNIFSNNGGYGINFSAAGHTVAYVDASQPQILNNCFFSNTSGKYNPSGISVSKNESTANPTYTNAADGNFSIGTNLKALGYPLSGTLYIGTNSITYSYIDIGAVQRQEAGGSSGSGFFIQ